MRTGDGGLREITGFPDRVVHEILTTKRRMIRYYFLTAEARQAAEKAMKGR